MSESEEEVHNVLKLLDIEYYKCRQKCFKKPDSKSVARYTLPDPRQNDLIGLKSRLPRHTDRQKHSKKPDSNDSASYMTNVGNTDNLKHQKSRMPISLKNKSNKSRLYEYSKKPDTNDLARYTTNVENSDNVTPVSYTHLTLPTTPYV